MKGELEMGLNYYQLERGFRENNLEAWSICWKSHE